jgi:hypothetical protein
MGRFRSRNWASAGRTAANPMNIPAAIMKAVVFRIIPARSIPNDKFLNIILQGRGVRGGGRGKGPLFSAF